MSNTDTSRPGLEHVRALVTTHGRRLAMIVNHSGGKDSARMLGFLCAQFPDVRKYVVYADTGFEHARPVSAEQFARENCARYGLTLHVVQANWKDGSRKTYLDMVARRGKFPAPRVARQCTSDLKRDPIAKFMRSLPQHVFVNCMGIRAAESADRAASEPWKLNTRETNGKRTVYDWSPIFTESLEDVLRWHWTTGTPLHPVYVPAYHVDGSAGGFLKRLSCRVCIFATNADLRAIYHHDREAFEQVAALEKQINFTMSTDGRTLFQIIGQPAQEAPRAADVFAEEVSAPCI